MNHIFDPSFFHYIFLYGIFIRLKEIVFLLCVQTAAVG